jgi:hypothetical protein
MLRIAATAAVLLFSFQEISGQTIRYISDLDRVLKDLDSIESPGLFRTATNGYSSAADGEEKGPRLKVLPIETLVTFNSAFPFGSNDGALWQGKGMNGFVQAGVGLSWSWGSLVVQPEWWAAQNESFPMAPAASGELKFEDYRGAIDLLQAYGSGPYSSFNPGQSELRFQYAGFTIGFGTENHKFGPAEIQNLLMSDNASGFPLLDIGTQGPYRTPLGAFDVRFFWGQTGSSQFWSADGTIDYYLYDGGLLSYSPPFLPGMSFGFQRVFKSPWSTMNSWKLFEFFDDTVWKEERIQTPDTTDGPTDDIKQDLSLTWEWRIPQTGTRAYIEWGRNDHSANIMDFMMQPDHDAGYVAGLQQKIELGGDSRILVTFEMADVGTNIGDTLRPSGSWYVSDLPSQDGYTEDGQVMGAPMGPGSNTQELDIYYRGGSYYLGLGMQRWLYDADYYYSLAPASYLDYDLLLSGTIRAGFMVGRAEIGASAAYTIDYNRNFTAGDDVGNWHMELSFKENF